MVGRDVTKKALRQFALPQMTRAIVRNETFVHSKDFSGESYYRGTFGAQGGVRDFQVVLHFDKFAPFYMRERLWRPTQTLKDLPRGGVELTMNLTDLDEVDHWTLSWGDHVTVKSPADLVERLQNTISRLADRYPK